MTDFVAPQRPSAVSCIAGRDHEYALWDAAYVLGSLSSTERHEYEAHLSSCRRVGRRLPNSAGMPALLSRLDRDEVAAIDDGTDTAARRRRCHPER